MFCLIIGYKHFLNGFRSLLLLLQVLLEAISLQRTKVTLGLLPPKIEETHYIELSFEERKQYVEVKKEAEETLQHYNNNRDQTLLPCLESLIVSLRQICTDSNLCSPHFKLRDFEGIFSPYRIL